MGGSGVYALVQNRALKYAGIFAEMKGKREQRKFYLSRLAGRALPSILYVVGTQIFVLPLK